MVYGYSIKCECCDLRVSINSGFPPDKKYLEILKSLFIDTYKWTFNPVRKAWECPLCSDRKGIE